MSVIRTRLWWSGSPAAAPPLPAIATAATLAATCPGTGEKRAMALINCHECQARISDQAESCPRCGAPTAYLLRAVAVAQAGSRTSRSQSDKFPWVALLAFCILTALTIENSHGADVFTQAYAVDWYVVTDVCKRSAGSPYQYAKNMNNRRARLNEGRFFKVETSGAIVVLTSYLVDENIGEYGQSHETYAMSKAACETFIKEEPARRQALADKEAQAQKLEAEKRGKLDSERRRRERERELQRRSMAGEKTWYTGGPNPPGTAPWFVCTETTDAIMLRAMRGWEYQPGLVTRWNPNYMDANGRYAVIEVMDGQAVNASGYQLAEELKQTVFFADRQECFEAAAATERANKSLLEEFKAGR